MPIEQAKAAANAEASVHASVRELAERAWREHGIRLDHVFISWEHVDRVEGVDVQIKSLSLTAHSYPR